MTGYPRLAPSPTSLRGLDGLNFFIANVQTGFGPFIAVYLTTEKWTQVDIGLVLTISGLVGLLGQVPGGALVDAVAAKRVMASVAVGAIAASALALAAWPIFPLVLMAEILHGAAGCLLGPAIATISLGLVGHQAIGEQLGRNAAFASVGNGIAAGLMGAFGSLVSPRSVFILTAALTVPALAALFRIRPHEIDPARIRGGIATPPQALINERPSRLHGLADNRPLMIFGGCIALFHFANAAMLPLMGSIVTMRSAHSATLLIAACIVVPQLVVACLSRPVGRLAGLWGRRNLLLIGFAALAVRGVLFTIVVSPWLIVPVQILDGISAAVLGVLLPLVVADITRGTGHFNAALGVVGTLTGVGASVSSTMAGYLTDRFGSVAAFGALAVVAAAGLTAVFLLMPETQPADDTDPPPQPA